MESYISMKIEDGIDFITSHFDCQSLFPRKMMTKICNYQFSVYSKEVIAQKCMESDFMDCRINAYPEFTIWNKYKIPLYPPNFIFIDLDLSTFSKCKNPNKMLDNALKKTLKKMSLTFSQEHSHHSPHSPQNNIYQSYDNKKTDINPTVLWSGNGYHIYLPMNSLILDSLEPFSKENFPRLFSVHYGKYRGYLVSEVFLLFAKQYFTDGKADPQHRPKYKTCLIRIPDTFNSKCIERGLSFEDSKVKVIKKWNGFRPPIQSLTRKFWKWLIQEEIIQSSKASNSKNSQINIHGLSTGFKILWIEKIMQSGIPDGRKETLRLILGPYLGKRKTYHEAVVLLENWLDKCNKSRPLDIDFNKRQRIQAALKNKKGFLSLENLKIKYGWLYDAIDAESIR
jgi:hypothetical protein